jgi:hypothetical protein
MSKILTIGANGQIGRLFCADFFLEALRRPLRTQNPVNINEFNDCNTLPTEEGEQPAGREYERSASDEWSGRWAATGRQFEAGLVLHISPRMFSCIRDVRGFSVVRSA